MAGQGEQKPPPLPHKRSAPIVPGPVTVDAHQSSPPAARTSAADHIDSDTAARRAALLAAVVQAPVAIAATPALPGSEASAASAQPDPTSQTRTSSKPPNSSANGSDQLWGKRLDVSEEIGRGAMGYVYRGKDTKLRRELAVKVSPLPRDKLPRAQLARFIEEAQVTAQLEHPNVVPVHDIGLDPTGRVFFSMKLIRGQSLEEILEKRQQGDSETLAKFGLRRLLDVFLHVCQAIEYAHARGVIHRDLKPANVMVGDFGEVLVMDWGVAKVKGRVERSTEGFVTTEAESATPSDEAEEAPPSSTHANEPPPRASLSSISEVSTVRAGKKALETQSGTVLGTPAYMSPEQAQGLAVDERSDLYALGVMLYEILCGEVPFADDDPHVTLSRVISEKPRRPTEVNPSAPLALETLALQLLEKDPERRTLTLDQIRSHVHNYIEGIGREYKRETLWNNVLWISGAIGLFAFLVWYITGQPITMQLAVAPSAVFNAVGWFLLAMACGYPLWAAYTAFRQSRREDERFRPPDNTEIFVSSYLAHRTFSAAIAPVFQLVFIIELVSVAVSQALAGVMQPTDVVQQIVSQLRFGWAHALMVSLVFLFGYLFLLSAEVRFARSVDRYEPLVARPSWESVWPFFLIFVLLLTIGTTDVLDWILSNPSADAAAFFYQHVLAAPPDPFELIKILVFQGTFLLGLVAVTLLLAFPFAEVLAAFRMPYQPADEAAVTSRSQYFLRSLAVFRVARANWLYGGSMIGCLAAIGVLTEQGSRPLIERLVYILVPSLIGFVGYWMTRRRVNAFLAQAPSVSKMLRARSRASVLERLQATSEALRGVSWRTRILQMLAPLGCILAYLVWTGTGVHQEAIRQLIVPISTKGWLLILPYALLLVVLIGRDHLQLWHAQQRLQKLQSR